MTVIVPSSLWQGTAVAGSRWTREQLYTLAQEHRDPDQVPVATIARRARVHPTDWTLPPPVTRTELPRLAIARNGRVLVITPAGAKQWMEPANG